MLASPSHCAWANCWSTWRTTNIAPYTRSRTAGFGERLTGFALLATSCRPGKLACVVMRLFTHALCSYVKEVKVVDCTQLQNGAYNIMFYLK